MRSLTDKLFFQVLILTIILISMSFKRTDSLTVANPDVDANHNYSQQVIADAVHPSRHYVQPGSLNLYRSQRIPTFLQSTLKQSSTVRKGAFLKKKNEEGGMRESKLGSAIRSKIKDIRNITNCEICDSEMKKNDKQLTMCDCEHKSNFCESCLHHYVIYKVKMFEEVYCPREGCEVMLDMNTDFFKQLPADIQKNYKKLHQFYVTSKDPQKKLCPSQNCQGLVSANQEEILVCDTCKKEFCSKCLLDFHKGDCDQHEVEFFQNNLHYRQCKRCKFVIEKNQGCNHMTCRCGYQFCYVCTADWSSPHYGNHDQNGNLVVLVPSPQNAEAQHVQPVQQACCDCACMDDCCGPTLACILKLPLKLIFFILFCILILMILIMKDLFVIIGIFIVTIFAGLFGFSFEMVCELEGFFFILSVLLFPIFMIAGVGVAFKEIFCDVIPDLCSDTCRIFCDGMTGIAEM